MESRQVVSEFKLGDTVDDQQVSCLWQNNYLLSVSLSGFINYLDVNNPAKPLRIIRGHNKPITVLTLSEDHGSIFTGSHDGFVTSWNAQSGENERIEGIGHGNQINGMKAYKDMLYTCGIDDTLKKISIEGNTYVNEDLKLGSQPRGMDIFKENGTIITATVNEVHVIRGDRKVSSLRVNYEPSSVSVNGCGHVAVGGAMDNKVHIYELAGDILTEIKELEQLGAITDLSYSPDEKYLVTCDAHRKVILYAVPEYEQANKHEWGFHNAKVNCVAWSPDSQLVASGSLDTNIIIWSVDKPAKHIIIKSKLLHYHKIVLNKFIDNLDRKSVV